MPGRTARLFCAGLTARQFAVLGGGADQPQRDAGDGGQVEAGGQGGRDPEAAGGGGAVKELQQEIVGLVGGRPGRSVRWKAGWRRPKSTWISGLAVASRRLS